MNVHATGRADQDLIALLEEVEAFFGKPAQAPPLHVLPSSSGLGLRQLAEALRAWYTQPVQRTTGCCGLMEIVGVYGASPKTIVRALKDWQQAYKPAMFYATTGPQQHPTETALAEAGFKLVFQGENTRYLYAYGQRSHITKLWVIDANHLPEAPTP